MAKFIKIHKYLLLLALLFWTSGCNSHPVEIDPNDPTQMDHSERMFRQLMTESRFFQSQKRVCLAFGNPLKSPSVRFLNRFNDLKERPIGLDRIQGNGFRKGYVDRMSGSPVVICHIARMLRLVPNRYIFEAGWFCTSHQSRKGIYEIREENGGYHISRISVSDRCRHLITPHEQHHYSCRVAY